MNIQTETVDAVRIIEIRRPEKKNALTEAMYRDLTKALAKAEADRAVRVVLFRGHAGVYTSGNDIADFLAHPPTGQNAPVFVFLSTIAGAKKPIVAAVAGPAVGIGTTMLLHCDYVVAGEGTQFVLPFVNLGLCPEAASSLLLPLVIGYRRAAEALMLGDRIPASKAHEWGLVNTVVADAEVDEAALAKAKELARKPVEALRATKALLKGHLSSLLRATLAEEAEQFQALLKTNAARECLAAFLEKRAPDPAKLTEPE